MPPSTSSSSSINVVENKRQKLKITIPSVLSIEQNSTAFKANDVMDIMPKIIIDQTSKISLNESLMGKNVAENVKIFADIKCSVIKQQKRFNRKQKRSALYYNENFQTKPWELISR